MAVGLSASDLLGVSESLMVCAPDRKSGSFAVVQLTGVPAVFKLRQVAMQVLAADTVKCAIDAAFEKGKDAFNRVRGHVAARIPSGLVHHGIVPDVR